MGAVAVVEAVDGRGNPLRVEALDRDRQVEIDAGLHKILPGFGGECLICIRGLDYRRNDRTIPGSPLRRGGGSLRPGGLQRAEAGRNFSDAGGRSGV